MRFIRFFIYVSFLMIFTTTIFSCKKIEPIRVGLVTDLSGKNSELGVSARNGLNLAIDEINSSGGINNRLFELIEKNHEGSNELCVERTKELVGLGVDVIISPILSGMTRYVLEGVGGTDTLVIGPTVSSDEYTGIDDNFLRVASPSYLQGVKIGEVVIEKKDKEVAIVIDERNGAYTLGVASGFINTVTDRGVSIVKTLIFSKSDQIDSKVSELVDLSPDGIFFIANGIDSARFIQLYAKEKELPHLYGSSWAKASNVEKFGGSRVEGMILVDSFMNDEPTKREVEFSKKYSDKFGSDVSTVVIYFYEAMYIYRDGVIKANSTEIDDVKRAIFSLGTIHGITEEYEIDSFGDGVRNMSLYLIKGNEYEIYNK